MLRRNNLNADDNCKPQLLLTVKYYSITIQRSKTNDGLQIVSDYSTAIRMLLTPPKGELHS
jgi:hypothetical protein